MFISCYKLVKFVFHGFPVLVTTESINFASYIVQTVSVYLRLRKHRNATCLSDQLILSVKFLYFMAAPSSEIGCE
jgi:hypothetical protein